MKMQSAKINTMSEKSVSETHFHIECVNAMRVQVYFWRPTWQQRYNSVNMCCVLPIGQSDVSLSASLLFCNQNGRL